MGPKKRYIDEKIKHLITAGVRDDFEELLQRFTATETVRYENFAEIWREMRMPFIFAGRQNEREAREFTEECLKIAAQYTMSPYHFQVRVGALYLMYAIFHTQPCILKGMIRMTPEMWHDLIEFQNEAHRQQHLDVDFIFHKLRTQNAFNFVATVNEMSYSRDGPDEDVSLPDELTEDQSALFDIFSSEVLEQLATVHQHYHSIKVALEGPEASAPSKSLSVIKPELISNITKAIVTYQDRRKPAYSRNQRKRRGDDTDDEDESEEEDDEIEDESYKPGPTSKKSKLKTKAFQNVAKTTKSRRHRQAKKADHTAASSAEGEQETESESQSNVAMDTSLKQESDAADAGDDVKQEFFSMPLVTAREESQEKPTKTKGKGKGKKKPAKAKATLNFVSSEDEKMSSPRDKKSPTKRKTSPKMKKKSPPMKESPSPSKKMPSPMKFSPLSDILPRKKGKKKSKGKKS